jgi:hypothetical protein
VIAGNDAYPIYTASNTVPVPRRMRRGWRGRLAFALISRNLCGCRIGWRMACDRLEGWLRDDVYEIDP